MKPKEEKMYKKIILILLIIIALFSLVYISYLEITRRNPYFDRLPQSDKNIILSATPVDIEKLFLNPNMKKNMNYIGL